MHICKEEAARYERATMFIEETCSRSSGTAGTPAGRTYIFK
jgi:hypothetical protein